MPEKEKVYGNLNMENNKVSDYNHWKRIYKDFEIKNLGQYHDLYLKRDTLLLDDVCQNFKKLFRNLLTLQVFFSPQISLVSSFEKDRSKSRTINWYWYATGVRGVISNSINKYAKANNKNMTD